MIRFLKIVSSRESDLILEIDNTVTFLQLLVKAHRNEEEEMTSKLVNKSAMMDKTLEEGVDRLIVKSNQRLPPNPSLRGNPDNSHDYGSPPTQWNQRPERNTVPNFQEPLVDIYQNLRGSEPSAAGPFRESDGSRLIQCFKCWGWGHPK